ncbi:MAG: hypothetical protein VX737_02640 [Pseudomonadota bacterium]|nr:hypothetical protein [Pseudomonadota bacterium]
MELSKVKQAKERAKRLLALRAMLGLSRDELYKRYAISKATLQNWESARAGGLTKRGAQQVFKAYQAENIDFTLEWLLHGIGAGPSFKSGRVLNTGTSGVSQQDSVIPSNVLEHILYYRKAHQDVFDMQLVDDAMAFRYPKNAFIGGVKYYHEQIGALLGFDCIVQIPNHDLIFRRLLPGNGMNRYHLVPINLHPKHQIYTDVEVIAAAKVDWMHAECFVYQSL